LTSDFLVVFVHVICVYVCDCSHGLCVSMLKTTRQRTLTGFDWSQTKKELGGLANAGTFTNSSSTSSTWNLM